MELEKVLHACLSVDNQERSSAEEVIQKAAEDASFVQDLLLRLLPPQDRHVDPQVRLMSAVLLRRSVARHWHALSPEFRTHLQAALLEVVVKDPEASVQRAAASVVSVAAKHSIPHGQWPELLPCLHTLSTSQAPHHRQLAFVVFSRLLETAAEHLVPHFAAFQGIMQAGLQDGEHEVRMSAVKATGALASCISTSEHAQLFRSLVLPLVEVASWCVSNEADDEAICCFQTMIALIEQPAPILSNLLPQVTQPCFAAAASTQLALETREQAVEVLHWLARYKPKQLVKSKLAQQALELMCQLMCEPCPDPQDDAGALPACKFAAQALDALSIHLPARHIQPGVLQCAQALAASGAAHERAAAQTMLAVSCEGAADAWRAHIVPLLTLVAAGLDDPAPVVQQAAAFALGQACENLQPEVFDHCTALLPKLFAVLTSGNEASLERGVYALDVLCEYLGDDILPHTAAIMEAVMHLLRNTPDVMADQLLSAMSSVANSAGAGFEPYVDSTLEAVTHYMAATSDALLMARARATECMGLVAGCMPQERLAAIAPPFMAAALEGWALEASELREYGHGMFGQVAAALGPHYAPYLAVTLAKALQSCRQTDGLIVDPEDPDEGGDGLAAGLGGGDAGPAPQPGDEVSQRISVHTGVMDEKSAAIQCLGLYAAACPAQMMPHMGEVLPVITEAAGYFHEAVRCQGYLTMHQLLAATFTVYPPAPGSGAVPPESQHVLEAAFGAYASALRSDEDKRAVTAALTAVGSSLKVTGRSAAGYIPRLCADLCSVLKGEARCQEETRQQDEAEAADALGGDSCDDDELLEDEELLITALETLPAVCAAAGPDTAAAEWGTQLLGVVNYRLKASQLESVRAAAMGCVAEVSDVLGPRLGASAPLLLPPLLREMRGSGATNRQNAAFAVGCLAGAGGEALAPQLPAILQAMHPLLTHGESNPGVKDNACSAVGRMLGSSLAAHMQLGVAVQVLCDALPLREDHDEAAPVYSSLCRLLEEQGAGQLAGQAGALVAALGQATVMGEVPAAVRTGVASCLAALLQSASPLRPLVTNLPPEQQAAILDLTTGRG